MRPIPIQPLAPVAAALLSVVLTTVDWAIDARPREHAAKPPSAGDEKKPTDKKPAATAARVARPAESLAGELVRVRPEKDRKDDKDLLNQIDLAKHVLYTTAAKEVPVAEQFQFVGGLLQTPEKGDARLVLPVDVPRFYRLTIDTIRKELEGDPAVGVGAVIDGQQFFVQIHKRKFTLDRFYGEQIAGPMIGRGTLDGHPGPPGVAEVIVGDIGFTLRHRQQAFDIAASGKAMSTGPEWEMPEKDKIFLSFPAGQFDLRSVVLQPLSEEQWIDQVVAIHPDGPLGRTCVLAQEVDFNSKVRPLPSLHSVQHAALIEARRGNFDELESWAARLRKEEAVLDDTFVAEDFYDIIVRAYVWPRSGSRGYLDDFYRMEFAFVDRWLKEKPDSVAARIVKGRLETAHALDARVESVGDAPETPQKLIEERLDKAQQTLVEASRLKTRDVCVFSSMLSVQTEQGANQELLDRTLDRAFQVSKKDLQIFNPVISAMHTGYNFVPGEAGKFAEHVRQRLKGPAGLDAYGRIAIETQTQDLKKSREVLGDDKRFFYVVEEFTDPKVLLEEFDADTLKAAIPVMLKRHPDNLRVLNYVCWLYCCFDKREQAKKTFNQIASRVDLDVWETRDAFDRWHGWADPSIPEPSVFLWPLDGKELLHLQAYADGPAEIAFLPDSQTLVTGNTGLGTRVKFWNLAQRRIDFHYDLPERYEGLTDLTVLADGALIVMTAYGAVEYDPPEYGRSKVVELANKDRKGEKVIIRGATLDANFRGLKFNHIADNHHSAARLAGGTVTINNDVKLKRETFVVPPLKSAGLSPNGNYFLGVDDRIHVWESLAKKELFTIDAAPKVWHFLADSSAIAFAGDDRLVVWDIAANQQRFAMPLTAPDSVGSVLCTFDSRFLISGQSLAKEAGGKRRNVIALWDMKQSEPIHTFDGHKTPIVRLAVSRDGSRLASASIDGEVKIWDLAAALAAPQP